MELDLFAQKIGFEVRAVREKGLSARAVLKKKFCNTYSTAHGGYVYAVGHVAAEATAELCLGCAAVVTDASNLYERGLKGAYARAETELLFRDPARIVCRVRVLDPKGMLCLNQIVTLRETAAPRTGPAQLHETLFPAGEDAPLDPVFGARFPHYSPFFGEVCHVFVLGRGKRSMIYAADIHPDTSSVYGAAHGGMIYTLCDVVTCGSAAFLLEKKPVTVSSGIQYLRPATVGPVRAEATLIRAGKQLLFYDVDITDGNGDLTAVAQFVLQSVNYEITNKMTPGYQIRAFRE